MAPPPSSHKQPSSRLRTSYCWYYLVSGMTTMTLNQIRPGLATRDRAASGMLSRDCPGEGIQVAPAINCPFRERRWDTSRELELIEQFLRCGYSPNEIRSAEKPLGDRPNRNDT